MRSIGWVFVSAAFALAVSGCSNVSTQGQTTQGGLTVTEVIPSSGPIAGNVPVQIKGTGFSSSGLSVKFGANAMSNPTLVDATTIHGTLPAATAAGQVDVIVTCGGSNASLPHGFTYTSGTAAITITGISPNNGPLGGGTQVTLTGTGFQGGQTSVTFGSNAGSGVNVTADTQLTVLTPPGAANGAVAVSVSNQHGTATLPNSFVYGNGGGGGGGTVQTTTEHLGGLSEFDKVADFTGGSEADSTQGFAYYFTPVDVTYPASGTCALDVNDGITSTIDVGNVSISQGANNLALTKDTSGGTPVYKNTTGASTMYALNQAAGITGSGSASLGAFNVASTATSPASDFSAWLDALGLQPFSSGGFWSKADLWIGWADNGGTSPGSVSNPVDHVQLVLEGQNIADGSTHVLSCDLRGASSDSGLFCVKGGYSNDLCQTSGSTMNDFYTAIGGPTLGFASSVVVLERSNRANYALPNSSNAAMDASILQATNLTMTGQ